MRQRHLQLLRHHLAEHGHSALPHIAFTTDDENAPVLVDLNDDGRAIPVANGAVAANVHGRCHTHTTALAAPANTIAALVCPANGLGGLLYALLQAGAADMPAMHGGITHLVQIAQVYGHRV